MQNEWLSIHIFYYDDQTSLLLGCVAPLVEHLRELGLIQHYFFLRYWAEGPHIRLRLLPAADADSEKIKYIAEEAITTFLTQKPALYVVDARQAVPLFKKLFIAEYGEAAWMEKYGPLGSMLVRENNSFAHIAYEPEYTRYGGVAGVELAEWHFEHSSDIVLRLLRNTNTNVHGMLLGRSIQLMLPLFYSMLKDDRNVYQALDRYFSHWLWTDNRARQHAKLYPKQYRHMAQTLRGSVTAIRRYMLAEDASTIMTIDERVWKDHLNELSAKIAQLYDQHAIEIDHSVSSTSLEEVYGTLLASYVHMTNNRLGIATTEESYLSFLLKSTLADLLGEFKEAM